MRSQAPSTKRHAMGGYRKGVARPIEKKLRAEKGSSVTRNRSYSGSKPSVQADPKHFVVAVDYGTTFSSVAFAALTLEEASKKVQPKGIKIHMVGNYPNAPKIENENRTSVPTESWYPLSTDFRKVKGMGFLPGDGARRSYPSRVAPSSSTDAATEILEKKEHFAWGYDVANQAKEYADGVIVRRAKLLLDDSTLTSQIRGEIRTGLQLLETSGVITAEGELRPEELLIADFLACLLRHSKSEFETNHGFTDDCLVEFVLCVPVIWAPTARRSMEKAMASAINMAGFSGVIDQGSVKNLFMVSEPEAAAAYALENPATARYIKPGDTFVLLDAGGGTVDAITYTVKKTSPLRLSQEAAEPSGALCGSSFLNERFEKWLVHKFQEITGLSVQECQEQYRTEILRQVQDFEDGVKRKIDVGLEDTREVLSTPALAALGWPRLKMDQNELWSIFQHCLDGVEKLMLDQIKPTRADGILLDHVFLLGGFGECKSLQEYLKTRLKDFEEKTRCRNFNVWAQNPAELHFPKLAGSAVASGAVLRALNKFGGPERRACSSYGFLTLDPYRDNFKGHQTELAKSNIIKGLNGEDYIRSINWVIKKGTLLGSVKEFTNTHHHLWDVDDEPPQACQEILYVSDATAKSHYHIDDRKNADAEIQRTIEVGVDFFHDNNLVKQVNPDKPGARSYFQVEYEVIFRVIGLDLEFFIRKDGKVLTSSLLNIAAAFEPGTA